MELTSDYYTGQGYIRNNNFMRYFPLYKNVISLLPKPDECPPILDLGCGAGYLAKMLKDRGYTNYTGIDFSPFMLEHCRNKKTPFDFILADLNKEETRKIFKEFSLFISLETLEHIENDIELIRSLPPRSRIICSLPTYNSKGHIRYFINKKDIIDRYSRFINIRNLYSLKLRKNRIFVFYGDVRNEH